MSAEPRQLALQLEHRPALGRDDFLVSSGNAVAAARVLDWANWPGRRLAVTGASRSGKTHLAHVWMHASGAERVEAAALRTTDAERLAAHTRVVVEDVDRIPEAADPRAAEQALFHLHNLLAAEGGWLMVTGSEAPGRWPIRLPDLASRLQAMPVARIEPPDDALLSSILIKLFADRQVPVPPDVIVYLVRHMERSVAEAERVVAELDRLSLAAKRRVTRPMAVALLGRDDAGAAADGS